MRHPCDMLFAPAFSYSTINEHKRDSFVKMHKRELSNHSQKSRLLPAIFCKVKNK